MTLKITIEMDNAAFSDDPQGEPSRILDHLAKAILMDNFHLAPGNNPMMLRDINGNIVWKAQVKLRTQTRITPRLALSEITSQLAATVRYADAADARCSQLEAQRDELLAALEIMMSHSNRHRHSGQENESDEVHAG